MRSRIVANLYGKHRPAKPPNAGEDSTRAGFSPLADNVPYRLQVVTQLRRRDLPILHKLAPDLVLLIEDAGLPLLHTSWEITDDDVHLYNYWDMRNDADSLTKAEVELPDNPAYAKFDRLIVDEIKDIVIPILPTDRVPSEHLDPNTRYAYLRVACRIDSTQLSEFAARIEASVKPFCRRNGWLLTGAYLGLTGRAGSIVQMWIVPEASISLAKQRISTMDWQMLVKEPPTYQVLEPTPTDPILGVLSNRRSPGSASVLFV